MELMLNKWRKYMIVICEGLDRVGKSTQIQRIKRYYEEKNRLFHILHYSNIKGPNIEERSKIYYKEMFELIKYAHDKINLILDRAHIGEVVYSPLYRNYSGEYVFGLEKLYEPYLYNTRLLVFIDRAENLITRDDGLSFTAQLNKKTDEIERFTEAYNKSFLRKALINIDGYDEEAVWNNFVKKALEEL